LSVLLNSEQVRRALTHEGRTLYAAVDVVAALSGARQPAEFWADLKVREPALAAICQPLSFAMSADTPPVTLDAVDVEGVLRLVQSIPTARAERVRRWLAQTARERLEEEKNPELAVLRTRRLYESKGYSRRWVDKRLRGVSARQELTGEWFKRGATESDQYRALTNTLMKGAFGKDVEEYRRHKNLLRTGENLRDHMTDLELALTALGETVAVELHRDHDSRGYEKLESDARAAGEIVARTRDEIEARSGRPVVQSGNHRDGWSGGRRRGSKPAARVAPYRARTKQSLRRAGAFSLSPVPRGDGRGEGLAANEENMPLTPNLSGRVQGRGDNGACR
jgi:hypothetical protein